MLYHSKLASLSPVLPAPQAHQWWSRSAFPSKHAACNDQCCSDPRRTFHRTFVVVCGIVLVWIWLCAILGTSSSRGRPAPTHRVGVAATRNKTYSNEAGGALSELLFPLPSVTGDTPWIQHNHKKLRAMFRCIENENCTVNQMKGAYIRYCAFRTLICVDSGSSGLAPISSCIAGRFGGRKNMVR